MAAFPLLIFPTGSDTGERSQINKLFLSSEAAPLNVSFTLLRRISLNLFLLLSLEAKDYWVENLFMMKLANPYWK